MNAARSCTTRGRECPPTRLAAAIAALTLIPSVLMAEPPYRLLEADYRYLEFDRRNHIDGFGLTAMFPMTERIHLRGTYTRLGDDAVLSAATLDAGLRHRLTGATDFVVHSGIAWHDDDGERDTGWRVATGLRSMTTPNMEVSVFARHSEVGSARTSIELGGRFALDPRFALAVGADVSKDDVLYRAGISLAF
jgi:hypothetical protein